MTNPCELLIKKCGQLNLKIAACESMTAGMFASMIADIPNASSVLSFSLVTYRTEAKSRILNIADVVEEYGVISRECANAMVNAIMNYELAEIGIAITGNAGPSVQDQKPVGLVYLALSYNGNITIRELNLCGSRNEIRKATVYAVCEMILETIH